MTDISLHISDIAANSLKAGCTEVSVSISILQTDGDKLLRLIISDNGCGIAQSRTDNMFYPFDRIKRGRRSGFGLMLLKSAAERAGGSAHLKSAENKGTEVTADFMLDSPDRLPLGDIKTAVRLLIIQNTGVDVSFSYEVFGEKFGISSSEIIQKVGRELINTREVSEFIERYIGENITELNRKYNLKGI